MRGIRASRRGHGKTGALSQSSAITAVDQSPLPLSLTSAEFAIFNRFWLTLKPHDQIVFYELILKAAQHRMAIDNSGYYLTFEAFLLSLVMEQHKEVQSLR